MSTLDTSKEAIAHRSRLREYAIQDKALALSESGMSNRDLGRQMDMETKLAVRIAACASQRRRLLAHAVPHPDVQSLKLTAPETLLLRSLTEVHFEQWDERETCSPDTGWVGRRVRKSKQWAVACARRRIYQPVYNPTPSASDGPDLVSCSGNGYISLTELGWSVAATLFPEKFDT